MIKKYLMLISIIFVIALFTSTSSASYLFLKGEIYEKLKEKSTFRNALERIPNIISKVEKIELIDSDESDEDNDLIELDSPKKEPVYTEILKETIDIIGELTPDNGNEAVVEENYLGETTTVDINGEEGTTLNDAVIVDENEKVEDTSKITVEKDGQTGRILEKVIEITQSNVVIGKLLQTVVEHTTYASGTTDSSGIVENIVDNVVVIAND